MDFASCLERLRTAFAKGPSGLSVAEWIAKAGVWPSQIYEVSLGQEKRRALAAAAAEMLGWDPAQLEAWFVLGQDIPDLEDFLTELPRLARCVGCKKWLPKKQVIRGVSRCLTCKREAGRLLAQRKKNPHFDAIFVVVKQKLPEIRAVHPALARALETCLQDTSHALTVARVQRIMKISRVKTEMLMKAHGLDKAAVAEAARSRCTFRCRFNRPGGQRRSTPFPRWAKEQNARWRRQAPAPNQIPLSLAGAA